MIAGFCTGCFEMWLCFYAQVKEWGETPPSHQLCPRDKCKFDPAYAMRINGKSGGITPPNLNFGTAWVQRSAARHASFTCRLNSPSFALKSTLDASQSPNSYLNKNRLLSDRTSSPVLLHEMIQISCFCRMQRSSTPTQINPSSGEKIL
jgi:hypothetical protein